MFVSLGSNCSITYWLNKLKLRKYALPFDWSSCNIKILNNILENNFLDYIDTLQIIKLSEKHLDDLNNPSMIISNKYNIKYAHEVLTNELDEFKKSLSNRINRFFNLKNEDFIIYVRIELSIIKKDYIKELEILLKHLDNINPNYILKLIIYKNTYDIKFDKIQIYYFDSFSPDWKMEHLKWTDILSI